MRTGTGQTLSVGTVFWCTEGNRWDIRQLPEPAGWFYIGSRHHRYPAFFGAPMSTGMISCNSQSLPVGIIGPVITGNAFFPIWYHIHGFAGPRELGWSDTLYSFLESDGPVQCNAPTCQMPPAFSQLSTFPTLNHG